MVIFQRTNVLRQDKWSRLWIEFLKKKKFINVNSNRPTFGGLKKHTHTHGFERKKIDEVFTVFFFLSLKRSNTCKIRVVFTPCKFISLTPSQYNFSTSDYKNLRFSVRPADWLTVPRPNLAPSQQYYVLPADGFT